MKAVWAQPEHSRLIVLLVLVLSLLHLPFESIPGSTRQPGPLAHTAEAILLPASCFRPGLLAAQVGGVQGSEDQCVGELEPVSTCGTGSPWEPVTNE